MTLRVGLLSTANINRKLLEGVRGTDEATVVAVASRDRSRAEQFAREHGIERALGSYEELLEDPEVEAVYIPLPNSLHVPWSIRALVLLCYMLLLAWMACRIPSARGGRRGNGSLEGRSGCSG